MGIVKNKINSVNIFFVIFLILLVSLSFNHFLLFHSLVELFSVVISFVIFIISFYSHTKIKNYFLVIMGIAYGFIGCFDLFHTLAYKGMGVFSAGANLPTQLWIIARYMESISFLIAVWYINTEAKKKYKYRKILYILLLVSVLILISIHFNIFPDCYIEGKGLTIFKIISEYIISGILLYSLFLFKKRKKHFETYNYRMISLSIIMTILSELSFTFYIDVYGLSNITGHVFKLLSVIFIFKAIVETGFKRPYDLIFRELVIQKNIAVRNMKEIKKKEEEIKTRYEEIKKLNHQLENIIYLTNRISITSRQGIQKFLEDVLNISYDLIEEADYGSVSIYDGRQWNVIKIIGYEHTMINELNKKRDLIFNSKENLFDLDIIKVDNDDLYNYIDLKNISPETRDFLEQVAEEIKESIFFDLIYLDNKRFRLSLDISAESSKVFNGNNERVLKAFRNLVYIFINLNKTSDLSDDKMDNLFKE